MAPPDVTSLANVRPAPHEAPALSEETCGLVRLIVTRVVEELKQLLLCRPQLSAQVDLGLRLEEAAAAITGGARQPPSPTPAQREPQQQPSHPVDQSHNDGGAM